MTKLQVTQELVKRVLALTAIGRLSEAKGSAAEAVMDIALISMGIRDAGIVVVYKQYVDQVLDPKTLHVLGIECIKLSNNIAYMVFRANRPDLRIVAAAQAAAFGATTDTVQGIDVGKAWKDAGSAFGYIHPSSDGSTTGGLSFKVEGRIWRQPITIMGPQSVILEDPKLLPWAMARCKQTNKLLRVLFGKSHFAVCLASFKRHV